MKFPPTPEQQLILDTATGSSENIIVQALAGAAKTSTLVLLAEALPSTDILCLAFNKKIAVEMAERLPANCTASTLNALGHRIWADAVGKRLYLDFKKMYNITSEVINALTGDAKERAWKSFKEIMSTAKEAKSSGYIPDAAITQWERNRPKPLATSADFFSSCEYDLETWEQALVDTIVCKSIEQAMAGTIGFDDQIYMSSCFRAIFPTHALVMVDEAQDLSALNHRFLTRLARKRLIAVGDPFQAIYGFRGAHESSMSIMAEQFHMVRRRLTTSFRCPQAIVDHVLWRAPDMKAWDGHPSPGSVSAKEYWSLTEVPDNAAVICRNNAPLYRMAVTFLKHGRTPKLVNSDIGKALITIMNKLGAVGMKTEDAILEVDIWLHEQLNRTRAKATVRDQADCMKVFLSQSETLGGAIHYAKELLNYEGAIQFMTGHKAKGLEFEDVFFLDQHLVGGDGQEPNLRYVICTRATRTLTYIDTVGCAEIAEELENN